MLHYAVVTLINTLETLIAFPTVTGHRAATDALMLWVCEQLRDVPVYVRQYEHNDLPSLVITPSRRKRVTVWLAAHVDVVAAPPELFAARRERGLLIGRGAIDMKCALACYIQLLQELGESFRDYDIGLMLTPDEEWGSDSSVRYLLEEQGFTGNVVFLPDGYGSWKFEEKAKGILGLRFETTGVAAHGSKPWYGRSAIEECARLATAFTDAVHVRFAHADDEAHWYTTANIGTMHGGDTFNVVAPHATATVDVRYVRKSERTALLALAKKLERAYGHTTHTITHDEAPYGIVRKNGHARAFARIAQSLYGIECGWVRSHGSSDARFFNRAGVPTLLIGPTGGESHGDHEWIDIADLERYYAVLRAWINEVARTT